MSTATQSAPRTIRVCDDVLRITNLKTNTYGAAHVVSDVPLQVTLERQLQRLRAGDSVVYTGNYAPMMRIISSLNFRVEVAPLPTGWHITRPVSSLTLTKSND